MALYNKKYLTKNINKYTVTTCQRDVFKKKAFNMTDNMNKLNEAAAMLQAKTQGMGYKKGIAAVNLMAEFMARGVNLQDNGQSFNK